MKKLLYILPAIALCFTAQSCKDDDFSKHSIDAQYETGTTTVAGTPAAAPLVVDYQSATIAGNLSSIADVVEQGIQISTSEDFSNAKFYANTGDLATDYNVTVSGLEGSTTYYARSYAITKAGGYVFGDTQTFTTPKTPIYGIEGIYSIDEYYFNDDDEWEYSGSYKIAIEFDPESGNNTDVLIYNLVDIDPSVAISGEYDEEEQKVYIPVNQYLGDYGSYGAVRFRGVNDSFTAYSSELVLDFTPLQGLLNSGIYNPYVSAGSFGFYRFAGAHDPDEE